MVLRLANILKKEESDPSERLAAESSDDEERSDAENNGITARDLASKTLERFLHPDTLQFLFNNQFGDAEFDIGSQECEHLHAYFRKMGIAMHEKWQEMH